MKIDVSKVMKDLDGKSDILETLSRVHPVSGVEEIVKGEPLTYKKVFVNSVMNQSTVPENADLEYQQSRAMLGIKLSGVESVTEFTLKEANELVELVRMSYKNPLIVHRCAAIFDEKDSEDSD